MLKHTLALCFFALCLASASAKKSKFKCDMTPEQRADKDNNFLSIIKHDPECTISHPCRCQNLIDNNKVQCKQTYAECPVSTGCSDRSKFVL